MNIIELNNPDPRNYIPDSINNTDCSNTITSFYGPVSGPQRGDYKCPFGIHENIGIFFRESIGNNTTWGRVPQLDPRPIARIGMEYRN